jgi:hypothetical protein
MALSFPKCTEPRGTKEHLIAKKKVFTKVNTYNHVAETANQTGKCFQVLRCPVRVLPLGLVSKLE